MPGISSRTVPLTIRIPLGLMEHLRNATPPGGSLSATALGALGRGLALPPTAQPSTAARTIKSLRARACAERRYAAAAPNRAAFLDSLAAGATIAAAARDAGIGEETSRRWRLRDAGFAAAVVGALGHALNHGVAA